MSSSRGGSFHSVVEGRGFRLGRRRLGCFGLKGPLGCYRFSNLSISTESRVTNIVVTYRYEQPPHSICKYLKPSNTILVTGFKTSSGNIPPINLFWRIQSGSFKVSNTIQTCQPSGPFKSKVSRSVRTKLCPRCRGLALVICCVICNSCLAVSSVG